MFISKALTVDHESGFDQIENPVPQCGLLEVDSDTMSRYIVVGHGDEILVLNRHNHERRRRADVYFL